MKYYRNKEMNEDWLVRELWWFNGLLLGTIGLIILVMWLFK
jgi:hypothetical protein